MDAGEVERDLATYYDKEAGDRATRALEPSRVTARDAFLASLPSGDIRLLEIGVGPGRDAIAFVERGITTVGVDLSAAHVGYAAATGAHAALATVRTLPLRDGAFGVVWTMSTLMHVPGTAIDDALREIRRVLAPRGVAAIGVWGGADVEDRLPGRYDPPRLFSRRSDERWGSMLSTIGTVEQFDTWPVEGDPFWYQWAVVRRS